MKILTALQLKELDSYTIKQQNISAVDLMERAANTCFDWIIEQFDAAEKYIVVCGQGNNGGDGLVLARLLSKNDCLVECILLKDSPKTTPSHYLNIQRLEETNCLIQTIENIEELDAVDFSGKIVIDSIFGTGLSRSAEGLTSMMIQQINQCDIKSVISIDVPSGMYCDRLNAETDPIVRADYTLTFHSPKQTFFFSEVGNLVGRVIVLDIGLDKEFAVSMEGTNYFISSESVGKILKKRETFTNKGSYGHVNILAGSLGKMGAAVMMAKGASYSGAGLVTATIPASGLIIMQTCLPTAMCDIYYGEKVLSGEIEINENYTYGIGPGIGISASTVEFIDTFLKKVKDPVVLDADALNIISEHSEMLLDIPKSSILTPHIKEFQRLVGATKDSTERIRELVSFATQHQVFVVLKDARTIICSPKGECFYSLNGTPGMATGGSGDVLAGILTGLLTQGYSSEETCQIGVILHGIAGELAADKYTEYAMTAESILEQIGNGFKLLGI